jgi:hypothetical protein
MVSNSLKMTEEALVSALGRIKGAHGSDPDYLEMRQTLPEDWPM